MKYGKLIIRVRKGKTTNNNNILGHDSKNKNRNTLGRSGSHAWKDFEKNEFYLVQ